MNRLFASVLHTSALRLAGQAIAFISGLLISSYFGASTVTDNYYTALILPAALANLVISILTSLFAPIYLEHLHRDPSQQRPLLASMTLVVSAALALATLISLIAVPLSTELRRLDTPLSLRQAYIFGFSLTALIPLIGCARLTGIICEAHQRYLLPALAGFINPLAFVLTLLLTIHTTGIYSLLYANLMGHLSETLILMIYARRQFSLTLSLKPHLHPVVREILALSAAPALTYFALFFVPSFDRTVAAALDPGSLTAFHYGERPIIVFDLIFVSSVLTVISNHWANLAAKQGIHALADTFHQTFSRLAFILVPLSLRRIPPQPSDYVGSL